MEQNNKLCYIAKGITVKIGFLNAALYDLKGKKVYLISIENAQKLLQNRYTGTPVTYRKMMELGLITSDVSKSNPEPLTFDYSLFQDAYDYKHCRLIYFEVTNICNYYCVHCYAGMKSDSSIPFLTYSKADVLLKKIAQAGKCDIRITGGEPFLNPEIDAIIELVSDIVTPMQKHSIATNGSFSYEQAVRAICLDYELQVSIYGMTENTFQMFTKRPASVFEELMFKLVSIAKAGYSDNVVLSMSVTEQNYCEIDQFIEFSKQYGFRYVLNRPASAGRAVDNWSLVQLSDEHQVQFAKRTNKKVPFFCYHLCQLFWTNIRVNGDVMPCPYFRKQDMCMGNLFQHDFEYIWNGSKYDKFRKLTAMDVEHCRNCEFSYVCTAGCCGETYSYKGDIKKSYPWCMLKPYLGAKYVDLKDDEIAIVRKYAAGIMDFEKL